MCGSDPPPPPDMSGIANANMEIARIEQQAAREQLDWAREQDRQNRAILNRVLDVQLPAAQEQFRAAKMDRQRYEQKFLPLENQYIQEVQDFRSPNRLERERGMAIADVNSAFDAQRRNALSRLESYGVDPSQTRNAALDIGVRTAQAAAQAGAATNAERYVDQMGRQLLGGAISLGRGLPGQSLAGYGGAVGAGGTAIGGVNQTTGTSAGALTSGQGFTRNALQGFGQSASAQLGGYNAALQGYDAKNAQTAGTLQGIGGIVGMAAGLADGGPPRQALPFMEDGMVETGMGDGSGIDDTVPAKLSDGEYVIPADVVRKKGEEFFDRLVEKYHTPAAMQEVAGGY